MKLCDFSYLLESQTQVQAQHSQLEEEAATGVCEGTMDWSLNTWFYTDCQELSTEPRLCQPVCPALGWR